MADTWHLVLKFYKRQELDALLIVSGKLTRFIRKLFPVSPYRMVDQLYANAFNLGKERKMRAQVGCQPPGSLFYLSQPVTQLRCIKAEQSYVYIEPNNENFHNGLLSIRHVWRNGNLNIGVFTHEEDLSSIHRLLAAPYMECSELALAFTSNFPEMIPALNQYPSFYVCNKVTFRSANSWLTVKSLLDFIHNTKSYMPGKLLDITVGYSDCFGRVDINIRHFKATLAGIKQAFSAATDGMQLAFTCNFIHPCGVHGVIWELPFVLHNHNTGEVLWMDIALYGKGRSRIYELRRYKPS